MTTKRFLLFCLCRYNVSRTFAISITLRVAAVKYTRACVSTMQLRNRVREFTRDTNCFEIDREQIFSRDVLQRSSRVPGNAGANQRNGRPHHGTIAGLSVHCYGDDNGNECAITARGVQPVSGNLPLKFLTSDRKC